MECIIFMGIQAAGKSTFYRERFFATHIRINLDMLRTRHRENEFVTTCIRTGQRFVIDNTNPTRVEREKYIQAARSKGFAVIGYFFEPDYASSVQRNAERQGKAKVPEVAIKSTINNLQAPDFQEGFDELYTVKSDGGHFFVRFWGKNTI